MEGVQISTKTLNSPNISSFLTSILTPSKFTAAKWAFLQRRNGSGEMGSGEMGSGEMGAAKWERRNESGEVSINHKKLKNKVKPKRAL